MAGKRQLEVAVASAEAEMTALRDNIQLLEVDRLQHLAHSSGLRFSENLVHVSNDVFSYASMSCTADIVDSGHVPYDIADSGLCLKRQAVACLILCSRSSICQVYETFSN